MQMNDPMQKGKTAAVASIILAFDWGKSGNESAEKT